MHRIARNMYPRRRSMAAQRPSHSLFLHPSQPSAASTPLTECRHPSTRHGPRRQRKPLSTRSSPAAECEGRRLYQLERAMLPVRRRGFCRARADPAVRDGGARECRGHACGGGGERAGLRTFALYPPASQALPSISHTTAIECSPRRLTWYVPSPPPAKPQICVGVARPRGTNQHA